MTKVLIWAAAVLGCVCMGMAAISFFSLNNPILGAINVLLALINGALVWANAALLRSKHG